MTTVVIDVTEEDIRNGKFSNFHCPIALAGTRALGRLCAVGLTTLWVYKTGQSGYLPIEARDFVDAFDGHRNVQPFSFELTLS